MPGKAVAPEGMIASPSFSHGVLVDSGHLFVAGQLALNGDGTVFAPYDIEAQLEKVWSQIEQVVTSAGGTIADIVRVTAWTTDRVYIPTIVAVRQRRFEGLVPPASALLVVAGLARAECLVEIDAFAVLASS